MEISQFLSWLLASGGSVIVASWILERVAWFQSLVAETKKYVFFGVSAVISCGAFATVTYVPKATLEAIAPWFLIVSGVFVTTVLGEAYHKLDK
jgi:hypothetical protein